MKNKWLIVLCLALSLCVGLLLVCCDKPQNDDNTPVDLVEEDTQKTILYLGDSIAEAVAGPSPIQERINYGYFGIIGQINNYKFDNRAISGNQTKDMLSFITREGEDGNLVRTLIRDADIIHISILGNDLLQYSFPTMLLEKVAREKYGEDYINEQTVKDFYVYNSGFTCWNNDFTQRIPIVPGWGLEIIDTCLTRAEANIGKIVSFIKEQNPDAVLMFQKVYNPVDDESELVSSSMRSDLVKMDAKFDYNNNGAEEVRKLGNELIGAIDGVLDSYLAKNPGAFTIIDALTAFDNIYRQDEERGKSLIYPDGVHPSSEGHAVLAKLIQDKLVELKLANPQKALQNYKALRKEQLERLYTGTVCEKGEFDLAAALAAVESAEKFDDVSIAYFDATSGYEPKLYSHPTEGRKTNGVAVQEQASYTLSDMRIRNLTMTDKEKDVASAIARLALIFLKDRKLTLNTDGTMEISVSADVGALVRGVSGLLGLSGGTFTLDNMLLGGDEDKCFYTSATEGTYTKAMGDVDMVEMVKLYMVKLFPGLDVEGENVGQTLSLTDGSIGLGISGADSLLKEKYTDSIGLPAYDGGIDESTKGKEYNSYIDYLLAYISSSTATEDYYGNVMHMRSTPAGLTEKFKSLGELKITVKCVYSLVTVTGWDGTEYETVYAGQYYEGASPWLIFTKYTDKDGVEHLKAAVEIMGIDLFF